MTRYLLIALAVLAVSAAMLALYFRGSLAVSVARQHVAEQRSAVLAASLKQSEAARAAEHDQAVRFGLAANQYEQDKTNAEDNASQLAADLRAERVRLRPVWQCPAASVPAVAASASQPDASAADRSESASAIVRAAANADAQIRALQSILTAERQP